LIVDREDAVLELARDGREGGALVEDALLDLAHDLGRCALYGLGASQEVDRLVAGDAVEHSVAREHLGRALLQERERASELVDGLLAEAQLLLRVVVEGPVPPLHPLPAAAYVRQRFGELDPARLEAARAGKELGALGIV